MSFQTKTLPFLTTSVGGFPDMETVWKKTSRFAGLNIHSTQNTHEFSRRTTMHHYNTITLFLAFSATCLFAQIVTERAPICPDFVIHCNPDQETVQDIDPNSGCPRTQCVDKGPKNTYDLVKYSTSQGKTEEGLCYDPYAPCAIGQTEVETFNSATGCIRTTCEVIKASGPATKETFAQGPLGVLGLAHSFRTGSDEISSPSLFVALSAVFHNSDVPAHKGKYIVVFHDHATHSMRQSFVNKWNARKRSEDGEFKHHNVHTFNALSGRFDPSHIEELLQEESVHYIEPNQLRTLSADSCFKGRGPWGVERLNTHPSPQRFSGTYAWGNKTDGAGVDAYVLDSGIDIRHPDFGGRASWGVNTAGDGRDEDCEGHGTHVAGTIGSNTYGIARKVSLIAVKCMGCDGRGDSEGILQAITWVAKQAQQKKRPSVVNMSLGGSYSRSENEIVTRAISTGVTFVIAAGNENQDACETSPASTPDAITVGASDSRDQFAEFSNYGDCVDIVAPGVEITSTVPGGKTAVQDGTSMASPHVAGVVAQILSQNPTYTPAQVANALLTASTPDALGSVPRGTPNKLLFSSCTGNFTTVTTGGGNSTSGSSGRTTGGSGFTSSGDSGDSGDSGSSGFTSSGFTSSGFTSGRTSGRTTTTTTTSGRTSGFTSSGFTSSGFTSSGRTSGFTSSGFTSSGFTSGRTGGGSTTTTTTTTGASGVTKTFTRSSGGGGFGALGTRGGRIVVTVLNQTDVMIVIEAVCDPLDGYGKITITSLAVVKLLSAVLSVSQSVTDESLADFVFSPFYGNSFRRSPGKPPTLTMTKDEEEIDSVPEGWIHGGANGSFPKNTIAGGDPISLESPESIEADVHVTKDNNIVMLHHPRLEKNGFKVKGLIKDFPFHGFLDELHTTQTIDFMLKHEHLILNVDVKMDNDPELLFSLMDEIMRQKCDNIQLLGGRIVLGLWHPKFIRAAKKHLYYTRLSHIGFSVRFARRWFWDDCESFSIHFAALITSGGKEFMDDCRSAGKKMMSWTVNTRQEMITSTKWRLQAVMTDDYKNLARLQHDVSHDWEKVKREITGWPNGKDWLYYLVMRYFFFDLLGIFFILWMGGRIHR
ncbi:aqualysin 1 [Planoprotostelium fungivorum]|uniref:Aqualysin 1 n=1 Tax=Planoprotostelium fungivorum TaxID=1890364 RepID=A0A2P6N8N6_9EUKA|nr:aqualysin 1 [Planoprotostelium fungivorum]